MLIISVLLFPEIELQPTTHIIKGTVHVCISTCIDWSINQSNREI